MKRIIFLLVSLCSCVFVPASFAKDVVLIYSGETHAMLYPCNCPIEPDGGVSRRAALIKQLRSQYPDAILVDSGSFTAGGVLDENTQNAELDTLRAQANIKAMQMMRFDAVGVSDDEFNFGSAFFKDNAILSLPLVSSNVKLEGLKGYVIKEVSGQKIAILSATNLAGMQKAEGIKFLDPRVALSNAVREVKAKGAGTVILLSNLGEAEDENIIKEIKGIDIVIDGRLRNKKEASEKKDGVYILRTSSQGRKLGKAVIKYKNGQVFSVSAQELRLSREIANDPEIFKSIPACFSDDNCKKEGAVSTCSNPGKKEAACVFSRAEKIGLTVISTKDCATCEPEAIVNFFKKQFPGVSETYYYYPGKKAKEMVQQLGITVLPAYIFGKELEKADNFPSLKEQTQLRGDYYLVKPQFSGLTYLLERPRIKGRFDLFISLFDKNAAAVLEAVKDFKPTVHFLSIENKEGFDAAAGNLEIEEYLRAVSVAKYYPDKFFGYISCRAKNNNSSWWEDCATGLDLQKIKTLAQSKEAKELLRQNISLNKELQVMFGPAYLADNKEAFATRGAPKKEELKRILKR